MSRKTKRRQKNPVSLIAHTNPIAPITEQYRLIRNNIHYSSVDKIIKTVFVTSADPAEGKSTTAANLAIVMAQKGKKTILVDADLRKPTVHYSFTVSNMEGLTSVLAKEISLEDTVLRTNVPNLDIITSGPIPPNPAELLDSKAMELLMGELKEMYEYIVIDSPPILAVTDPQIMATKCDGVVLVVASGKTQKDRAVKAKELLERSGAKIIGVVVNGVEEKLEGYYGHYR
ncbi:capsular biosynthesis protein [Mesobacillus campisalis]|uniref:non-specific protein-tyrosine kinase n=1 Tax=Mesobacillus campisalis TaxID=1408103 RepID=A0A0M2SQ00_9BACI|nr:CpsD/CapB family tyrosine-protein kinase [Mesobacillus campisalis]KKK36624.1 capsular biosynthesis protein [Mesobacillus campisalis]